MIFLIPVATPGTSARINMSEELYYKDIFLSIVKIIQICVNSGSLALAKHYHWFTTIMEKRTN